MSAQPTPRRARLDAVALALAFLAADGAVIFAMLAGWIEVDTGIVAVLAASTALTTEQRRRARRTEGVPSAEPAAPPQTFARASGILKA